MEEPEDSGFKNDYNNKAGFNKENTFQYLINIFKFDFYLYLKQKKMSLIVKKKLYNIYSDLANEFKKPKELFEKIIYQNMIFSILKYYLNISL